MNSDKGFSARDKIVASWNFKFLLESLDEYIEKGNYYPNFKKKRQFQNITVPKEVSKKLDLNQAENLFEVRSIIFVGIVQNSPASLREELRNNFYRWIDYVGITSDSCPEKLKHFLIEIHQVLGNWTELEELKIYNQTKGYHENKPKEKHDPHSSNKLFSTIHENLHKIEEEFQALDLEGKTHEDIKLEKFKGEAKQGKQIYEQIVKSTTNHDDFNFFLPAKQSSSQQSNSTEPKPSKISTEIIALLIVILLGCLGIISYFFWKKKKISKN